MKKQLLFCLAFVAAMTSCVKEPQIYRRLNPDEAAVIPYRMGETIRMLDQDGDTLCFTVASDSTFTTYSYSNNHYYPETRMSFIPQPYFYMREVVLQSQPEDSCLLRCSVAPDKVITLCFEELRHNNSDNEDYYYWYSVFGRTLPLNELATTTFDTGETTYENVHFEEGSYMSDTTNISYAWYYSETEGLLAVKHGSYSLTWIP